MGSPKTFTSFELFSLWYDFLSLLSQPWVDPANLVGVWCYFPHDSDVDDLFFLQQHHYLTFCLASSGLCYSWIIPKPAIVSQVYFNSWAAYQIQPFPFFHWTPTSMRHSYQLFLEVLKRTLLNRSLLLKSFSIINALQKLLGDDKQVVIILLLSRGLYLCKD